MTEQLEFQPIRGEEKTQDSAVLNENLDKDFLISTLGGESAGKSTLVSCLVRHVDDDGKGRARSYVLQHPHELDRGRSSAVALSLMGFSNVGQVVRSLVTPEVARKQRTKDIYEVASKSYARVTFVDLCGHENYLKTTIDGLTRFSPHAAMVVIAADSGIMDMTREHVELCCALQIPFFIVITNTDRVHGKMLEDVRTDVKALLKIKDREVSPVTKSRDIAEGVQVMGRDHKDIAVVLETSCVTGDNIEILRGFIKLLATKQMLSKRDEKKEKQSTSNSCLYSVHDAFNVPEVGLVLGGRMLKGSIRNNEKLYVGPDSTGGYGAVTVTSIHRNCVPSETCFPGQYATIAIKTAGRALKRDMFRNGMVVCGEADYEEVKKRTVYEFEAEVVVLHPLTTFACGYCPLLHIGGIRQNARVLEVKSSPNKVIARFRFLGHADHLQVGTQFLFREKRVKGSGHVTKLFDQHG